MTPILIKTIVQLANKAGEGLSIPVFSTQWPSLRFDCCSVLTTLSFSGLEKTQGLVLCLLSGQRNILHCHVWQGREPQSGKLWKILPREQSVNDCWWLLMVSFQHCHYRRKFSFAMGTYQIYAPVIQGAFALPPTSKETANYHASRRVRYARAVMSIGIASPRCRGKRSQHSRRGACATRNFTYLVRGPWPKHLEVRHDWYKLGLGAKLATVLCLKQRLPYLTCDCI